MLGLEISAVVTSPTTSRYRSPGVADVRPHRQQAEHRAEQVPAFGDPGDGLDVQGVQGKDRGGESGGPAAPRRRLQHAEQQYRADRVQQRAVEVMPGRAEPEQLDVEHVRDPHVNGCQ